MRKLLLIFCLVTLMISMTACSKLDRMSMEEVFLYDLELLEESLQSMIPEEIDSVLLLDFNPEGDRYDRDDLRAVYALGYDMKTTMILNAGRSFLDHIILQRAIKECGDFTILETGEQQTIDANEFATEVLCQQGFLASVERLENNDLLWTIEVPTAQDRLRFLMGINENRAIYVKTLFYEADDSTSQVEDFGYSEFVAGEFYRGYQRINDQINYWFYSMDTGGYLYFSRWPDHGDYLRYANPESNIYSDISLLAGNGHFIHHFYGDYGVLFEYLQFTRSQTLRVSFDLLAISGWNSAILPGLNNGMGLNAIYQDETLVLQTNDDLQINAGVNEPYLSLTLSFTVAPSALSDAFLSLNAYGMDFHDERINAEALVTLDTSVMEIIHSLSVYQEMTEVLIGTRDILSFIDTSMFPSE